MKSGIKDRLREYGVLEEFQKLEKKDKAKFPFVASVFDDDTDSCSSETESESAPPLPKR